METLSPVTTSRLAAPAWLRTLLLAALVGLAALAPRWYALDRFAITDEPLWVVRSARFAYALQNGDFAATYQREHPGVTIMWAGAAAYWYIQPQFNGRPALQLKPERLEDFFLLENDTSFLVILVTARRILALANAVVLALAFLYARRILGDFPALVGFLIIALDPFHIALTRILHLDGLLSSLMLLSTLAFITYLNKPSKLDLLVSAAAAGLAWLTKSPGFMLGLVIGLLALYRLWREVASGEQRWNAPALARAILPVAAWSLAAAVMFFAAWPAMWVAPAQTLGQVFSMAGQHAEAGHESAVFFNGNIIPDGALGWQYAYFYPLTYLWRTTPVVLAGLLLAAWAWRKKVWPGNDSVVHRSLLPVGMLLLALGFAVFMTLGAKKFDRYLIPAYPPLDLLAGVGWGAAAGAALRHWKTGVPALAAKALVPVALFAAGLVTLSVSPYYFSYYNPLLGGSRSAVRVMQIGWGEGLDQAARYLLDRDGGRQLKVLSYYAQGCFTYFFPGETHYIHNWQDLNAEELDELAKSDYALIYINQVQRNLSPALLKALGTRQPEYVVRIDGIDYVSIYRLR